MTVSVNQRKGKHDGRALSWWEVGETQKQARLSRESQLSYEMSGAGKSCQGTEDGIFGGPLLTWRAGVGKSGRANSPM